MPFGAGTRRRSRAALLGLLLAGCAVAGPSALRGQDAHALIVVGIGGAPEYAERFHGWAADLHDVLAERHGVSPERITYLGERPQADPARISGPSRRENVEAALEEMAGSAGPQDKVLIVIFGHGSTGTDGAVVNLPGPDMSAQDFARLLLAFPSQQVAFVNTTPASAPFLDALAGPRRTVVTATRSASERNETLFGQFFVAAYTGDLADLDHDGRISVLEAFEYARQEVSRHYQDANLIVSEHAMLEDDGDGEGSQEPDPAAGDGRLASAFMFGRTIAAVPDSITDPVLRGLMQDRAELQRQLDALRDRQDAMPPEEYDAALEAILIEIALKDREIRARGGGNP